MAHQIKPTTVNTTSTATVAKAPIYKRSGARRTVIVLTVVACLIGIFSQTGTGTLSAFGWQAITAICPVGTLEVMLAEKLLIPRALVVLVAIIILTILIGKAFCAWICPIPSVRRLLDKIFYTKKSIKRPSSPATAGALTETELAEIKTAVASSCQDGKGGKKSLACSSCAGCATTRAKLDSRHLVLGGTLISSLLVGFPVFCLVCPVGLFFASAIAVTRLVGFNEPTFSLLLFPLILILELTILKKWCSRLCPMGALVSLFSLPNRWLKPVVDETKCLRSAGTACTICLEACEEGLDPHYASGMHECSKCLACVKSCPAGAIKMKLFAKRADYATVPAALQEA